MRPPVAVPLVVVVLACAARLHAAEQLLVERFATSVTGVFPPAGWSEVDVTGSGFAGWEPTASFCGNLSGSDLAGHDAPGIASVQETRLVSPALDFSTALAPRLNFHSGGCNLWALTVNNPSLPDEHDVEVSTDGGQTWTEAFTVDTNGAGTYERRPVTVDLSAWAGEPDVRIAFRYRGGESQWALDNVIVVDAGTAGALHVVGSCGQPGSYVFADGVTPLANVAFVFGRSLGGRIYSSPACTVLASGLGTDPPNVVAVAQATGFGYAQVIPPNGIPAGACGGFLQAFDLTTCMPTPVLQL